MTDVSPQEGNTNIDNETLADNPLQIEALANSLLLKVLQGVNERLPNLVTNIIQQKSFVSTIWYDESDEEESNRDTGTHNNQMVRDAGAQQISNRGTGA